MLERLHDHLANLRREGLIDTWYDRKIPAGYDIEGKIDSELETAQIFLLLISPDFIASDYCVGREMTRALHRQKEGAIVVPIIIEPCDWKNMPISRLKALPDDGKPISEFTNHNTAFLQVVTGLRSLINSRRAAESLESNHVLIPQRNDLPVKEGSRTYNVKRTFTSIDKSNFADRAFSEIRAYFESATAELGTVAGIQTRFANHGPASFGCAIVNQSFNSGRADITVRRGDEHHLGDIFYSFSENALPNTMHGGFNVANDEYRQFLSASFSMRLRSELNQPFSAHEAAEMLWNDFIEQAGLSVAS